MPKDLEAEIADMLDDDFPTPLDEEGEEGEESGGDSVPAEGEEISAEPTTPVEGVEGKVAEKEVPPNELPVEGTPKGGEPAKEEEGKVVDVEGGKEGEVEKPVEGELVGVPPSELDTLKAQVGTLMGLLNTAHQGGSVPQVATVADPVAPINLDAFMQGVDFDSVMESKESFVNFFTKSMEIMQQQTAQSVMASVPNYISEQVQRNTTMRDVASEFYSVHPELSPVKGYVANVASEVSANNPTWDMAQVLTKTAELAKNTLGLAGQSTGAPTPVVAKPAPVLSGGTRTAKAPSAKKSGLQTEIDDFLTD